ncbi:putative transporter [Lachnellula suecica]|uniref:Putative transporter n=1 Tax=Lachnellula suecica TaxID=602035 RepID=A0A8T9CE01_9HELO|nr:putative transporter [Lachnellula suecica]
MSSSADEKFDSVPHSPICGHGEDTKKNLSATASVNHLHQTELLSKEEEEKLVWKIDTHLLPLQVATAGLQFLDKTSLAFSAILGLRASLDLVHQEFNWTSSIFYLGYLIACYPIAWCFVKFPLGKFISIFVIGWGAILALHAVAKGFPQLMVLRTFLGALESPITPGFSLITSMWYTPREHASRHCFWFAGSAVASILGALVAYGLLSYHGSMAQWRLQFLVLGVLTVAWGMAIWFLLPDSPETAYFLTPSERTFAALRPRKFQRTSQLKKWSRKQFVETLKDLKSWWFFIFLIVTSIPAGGFTTFGTILIQGFGFSPSETLLMTIPTNTVILIGVLIAGVLIPRLPNSRLLSMAALNIIAGVGCLMTMLLPEEQKIGRLVGLWLSALMATAWPLMLSVFASNTAGFTKKSTTSVFLFIGYCVGNILAPQFFFAAEAPRYETAYKVMLSCLAISVVMVLGLRVYLDMENKRRDRIQGTHVHAEDVREVDLQRDEVLVEVDETDQENLGFRYAL